MVFGAETEVPKSGSTFFTPSGEEDRVVFGKDSYTVLFKEYSAAVVTELANSDKVVFDGGRDLCVADR